MKKFLFAALVLMMSALFAGCASTEEGKGQQAQQTDTQQAQKRDGKIVVSALYYNSLENFEALVEKTYDDIDFEVEKSAPAVYNSDTLRRLKNSHGKDIIFTSIPNGEISGYMIDLSPEAFSARYENATMDIVRQDGKTVYLPMPSVYRGIIVNKTLISEMGLELPKTQQEFLDMLQKAKDSGVGMGEDGMVFATMDIDGISFGEMALSTVVPDFLGLMDGERWLGSFLKKEADMDNTLNGYLQFFLDLTNRGFMNPARIDTANNGMRSVDVPGRMEKRELIAAYSTSDILMKIREGNNTDEFIMIPSLSSSENSGWVTTTPTSYIGINSAALQDAEKLDACKRVLDILSTAAGQEAVLADTQTDSSYLISEEVKSSGGSNTGLESYVESGYVYNLNRFNSDVLWLFGTNIAKTINGKMELADALKSVDNFNKNGAGSNAEKHTLVGSVNSDLLYENYNTRRGETALGNLITDAVAEISGADIVFVNGGSIRASLYAGDVYTSDLAAVFPYGNTIVVVEMEGKVMRKMLENSISSIYYNQIPGGKFLQVHGINYTISLDKSTEVNEEANPHPAEAVLTNLTLPDGTPIEDDKLYKAALTNYMCGSSGYEDGNGDGYTMLNLFSDTSPKAEGITLLNDCKITYADAIIEYFANHSNEEISAALEGRITVEERKQ